MLFDPLPGAVMNTKRKLTAILSADVVGYSRLMAQDEEATVSALNHSRVVFRNAIESRGGRVIDTAGDSVLAEFASAVEAVRCATEVQGEITRLNAQIPEQRRMLYRIGVNLGDVVEQDGTLYGDGVNVAARLQALSEPGGVWIAASVFDQVEGKLPLAFILMGEQTVKNIPRPIRAYRVALEASPAAACLPTCHAERTGGRGAPLHQHEWRPEGGLLQRRNHGGHHHRTFEVS